MSDDTVERRGASIGIAARRDPRRVALAAIEWGIQNRPPAPDLRLLVPFEILGEDSCGEIPEDCHRRHYRELMHMHATRDLYGAVEELGEGTEAFSRLPVETQILRAKIIIEWIEKMSISLDEALPNAVSGDRPQGHSLKEFLGDIAVQIEDAPKKE